MQRSIAAFLGALSILNGAIMLFAGPFWYASVPGASETGPYNPHFVQDIGAAFLIAGVALAARAWRPLYWPAAVAGAGMTGRLTFSRPNWNRPRPHPTIRKPGMSNFPAVSSPAFSMQRAASSMPSRPTGRLT